MIIPVVIIVISIGSLAILFQGESMPKTSLVDSFDSEKFESSELVLMETNGSTAATSFFSFFSLVPLGCCGWWLYALSLLPGIVGTGVTSVLIEYSQVLAYVGLLIIFGFAGLTALKLQNEIKLRNLNQGIF